LICQALFEFFLIFPFRNTPISFSLTPSHTLNAVELRAEQEKIPLLKAGKGRVVW